MLESPPQMTALPAALGEWLDTFAACVRDRDLDAGRRLCSPAIYSFGTRCGQARGLDQLVEQQWAPIWNATHGFTFHTEDAVATGGGPDDQYAFVAVTWSSNGSDANGRSFPRHGRATIGFERDADNRWLATHTHFSMEPVRKTRPG